MYNLVSDFKLISHWLAIYRSFQRYITFKF